MDFLTPEHEALTQAQESELIARFKGRKFDERTAMIATLIFIGIGSFAVAWHGESSDRVFYCIKQPDQNLRCNDRNNRPFRLTKWHWDKWGEDGRPPVVIPNPNIAPDGMVKGDKGVKPAAALLGFASFAAAGYLFRTMQHQQKKLAIYEDMEEKRDQAEAELQLRFNLLDTWGKVQAKELEINGQLELVSTEQAATLEQAEILAKSEIQITEIESQEMLYEAETAGMTEEQKRYYRDFVRNQKTPYLSGTTSLGQTIDPTDKIDPTTLPIVSIPANTKENNNGWIKAFLRSTCLVWGNQGGGKSWYVRYLALEKIKAGYKVIVFDPNSNAYEWQGVELINTYEKIQEKVKWYVQEVMTRYRDFAATNISEAQWRQNLWDEGKAYTIICEEMSTYADFILDTGALEQFVKVATTLSRKQEMPVVFVSHNNTQSCLGNIKGLANLISRMQQIQLIPATDEETNQPTASGKALIKYDGSEEWVPVTVPRIADKIRDFSLGKPTNQDIQPKHKDIIPPGDRTAALTRILNMLTASPGITQVITLIPTEPDKALWLGMKILNMGITSASKDIFNCGDGGKAFQKAKTWYESLQTAYGQIKEQD